MKTGQRVRILPPFTGLPWCDRDELSCRAIHGLQDVLRGSAVQVLRHGEERVQHPDMHREHRGCATNQDCSRVQVCIINLKWWKNLSLNNTLLQEMLRGRTVWPSGSLIRMAKRWDELPLVAYIAWFSNLQYNSIIIWFNLSNLIHF